MKSLKIMFFIFLILLIPYQNYPQAMLKNIVNIESGTKKDVVDKVYKSKNDYLDINIDSNNNTFTIASINKTLVNYIIKVGVGNENNDHYDDFVEMEVCI